MIQLGTLGLVTLVLNWWKITVCVVRPEMIPMQVMGC